MIKIGTILGSIENTEINKIYLDKSNIKLNIPDEIMSNGRKITEFNKKRAIQLRELIWDKCGIKKVNIKNQELLLLKTKYEINLHRLNLCSQQIKLGVRFREGSDSAVTCQDIEVFVPPNQVLPHVHSLSSSSQSISSQDSSQ